MRARLTAFLLTWVLCYTCTASPTSGQQTKAAASKHNVSTGLQHIATLIANEELARAEAELGTIFKSNAHEPRALNLLGVIRVRQNRASEAEDLYKRALAASPRLSEARVNLGLLYMSTERVEEAAAEFEEALRAKSNRNNVRVSLVATLRRVAATALAAGDREKALAHLLQAKRVAPADADVLFEFAMVALGKSLHDDATSALVTAVEKRPREPKFIYALARARLAKGELLEAERLFRQYVIQHPADPTGHYGLGYVLMLLKQTAEAKQFFERSLQLQPQQTESSYQLGLLAYAAGDVDRAFAWFAKVLTRYADHAGALLGMGQVHFSRKHYEAAQQSLERAIALEPSLQKAHYYLSMTYARLGNKEAAAREAGLAAALEREQKDKRRIVLRLLERGPTASAGEQKP